MNDIITTADNAPLLSELAEALQQLNIQHEASVHADDLPKALPVSSIKSMPEVFYTRGKDWSEYHVGLLCRTLQAGFELEPLLVIQIADAAIVVDGHHRLEAYKRVKQSAQVPVRYFTGTPSDALLEAVRCNAQASIQMDGPQRHATGYTELDAIDDISDPGCPVRFVITVQKLREGWDCPFAYILCSVAELSSPTAVEQLLGRVLRMPKGRRKTNDLLNRAYAFVASSNFQAVAERLKDGLVDGAGFDPLEAAELIKPHEGFDFAEERSDYEHQSDALPNGPAASLEKVSAAIDRLPPALRHRVSYDPETRQIAVTRALSRDDRNQMHLAFAGVSGSETVITKLFIKSNTLQATEIFNADRPPFLVPRLGFYRQGELELFAPDHFLDLPWNLAECPVDGAVRRFAIHEQTKSGEIDLHKGRMTINFVGQLHDQLSLAIHEPAWTLPRLVNWIDRGIPHPDVTKPAARVFIFNALEAVMASKGYSLDQLARYKYELRRSLTEEIKALRADREKGNFNALFSMDAGQFKTSSEIGLIFDEQSYAYNEPYKGARRFNRHYFPIVGDLKPTGEDFRCAVHLDEHPSVRYWVRNVDRKPNALWLQLSSGRFYPDFVVMLREGRVGAVEYNGAHLAAEAAEKRMIGTLWADASEGRCVFAMPTDNDFSSLDAVLN